METLIGISQLFLYALMISATVSIWIVDCRNTKRRRKKQDEMDKLWLDAIDKISKDHDDHKLQVFKRFYN